MAPQIGTQEALANLKKPRAERPTVWRGLAAGLVLLMMPQPVMAEHPYPDRPIRFVVAFAPGGITDIIARLVGERLSDRLGQPVVIDNKGGAAGALGAKIVAGAEPDGYTILVTTTAIAIGSAASPTAIDPRKQLTPIVLAASTPTIIATKAPNPAKNLMEFVRAKADGRCSMPWSIALRRPISSLSIPAAAGIPDI